MPLLRPFDYSRRTWFSKSTVVNLTEQQQITTGQWRELWSPPYLRTSAVIAGGVVLYSTNEFLTISMLPSTVNEIGGERIYAWVTTLYLVGSVVAAATVNTLLHRIGACISYLMGFAVLGVGSLVCAAAPTMEVLLAGRFLQGLAGGLLCGLSFAVINAVLPRALWSRGSAMAASTWGIGALVGPAMGGLFAQFGAWRWAFGLLAMLSVAMAGLAPGLLSMDGCEQATERDAARIPVPSVVLLGAAALTVSVASLPRNSFATACLLILGALLVGAFLVVDRRMDTAVLPASVYGFGPLKWVYLTLGLLVACHQGGSLRSAVRSAAGAPGADRCRAAGCVVVTGLDDQRTWQRLAEQGALDRGRGDRCAAGNGGRPGAGRGRARAGRDDGHRHRSAWWAGRCPGLVSAPPRRTCRRGR